MVIVGYILCVLGAFALLAGHLMILTAAYHRGPILFLGCVLVPFAVCLFALWHLKRLWMPLGLVVGGCGLALGGFWLQGYEYPLDEMFR